MEVSMKHKKLLKWTNKAIWFYLYISEYEIYEDEESDINVWSNIKKNQLVKDFKTWGKVYKIEFAIKVDKLPTVELTNAFHFTTNDNNIGKYGDGIPAVYITKSGSFLVCSAVNDDNNFCKDYKFELGKKYHATIKQFKKDEKYWYEIIADGESKFKTENGKPRRFANVKLYGSDPWHPPFSSDLGMISDVKITVPSIDAPGMHIIQYFRFNYC